VSRSSGWQTRLAALWWGGGCGVVEVLVEHALAVALGEDDEVEGFALGLVWGLVLRNVGVGGGCLAAAHQGQCRQGSETQAFNRGFTEFGFEAQVLRCAQQIVSGKGVQ
jgi:hypothetical protein